LRKDSKRCLGLAAGLSVKKLIAATLYASQPSNVDWISADWIKDGTTLAQANTSSQSASIADAGRGASA
jgi:hypothetical protein